MSKIGCALLVAIVCTASFVPAAAQEASEQTNGRITLDIKGMDLVDALKMLAARSGVNIVVGKNVSGKVTMFLKDVDIWSAFEIILAANDLAFEKKDGIVYVMTQKDYESMYGQRQREKRAVEIARLEYARAQDLSRALTQMKSGIGKVIVDENSNSLVISDTPEKIAQMREFIENADIPIQTRVFTLNYAQAEKLSPKIQEALTKGVGTLQIDERTNKIAVTDYAQKLDEISGIIRAFDEKTAQVLIDAQIIEIKPSDKFEMGIDWDFWIEKYFKMSAALPISHSGRLLLGTADTTPTGKGQYKAVIDLLRTVGETRILSSPRIMALNNQEAKILVGSKEAYITSTTSQSGTGSTVVSQNVNFVDVGIKLYVTPTINTGGFVTMKIRPEISSSVLTNITSVGQVTQVPIVSTSETETTVMVKDGVTIIIGGLKKDEKTKTESRMPILGDIPFLGRAFTRTSDEVKKTELVILLTPRIVSGESTFTEFSDMPLAEQAFKDGQQAARPGTPPPAPVSKPATGAFKNEEDYRRHVWSKINKIAIGYMRDSTEYSGSAEIVFTIGRDGRLTGEPRVLSSNNRALHVIAIKSIRDAAPFPPLPGFSRRQEMVFRTTFYSE